ncbi:uncharacterized protein LOC135350958 [Halichondria panicea]|uniref:uncharacterized protein LOC135350958 n=1 Tax=Halichondria panicea TaxID=6063 RepID=UPI00312B4192
MVPVMTELRKKPPLSDYQLTFLRPYILRKRKSEQLLGEQSRSSPESKQRYSKDPECVCEDNVKSLCESTQELKKKAQKQKESQNESPVDIAEQIKILQDRLESLKKEKHSLFQQLKVVLYDEDEKKQEEQRLEIEKTSADMYDPRQQGGVGLKRPYTSILSMSYPGVSPLKRQQRGPLLPTPEGSSPTHFSRQSSGGSFHGNAEVFPQGGKSLYVSRSSSVLSVNRPPFLEQRVGPPYNVPSDVHMQGPHPSAMESPLLVHSTQAGVFVHPNPLEMQTQFQGMGVGAFQFTSNPPFNSVTNIHSPSGPSQHVQMQFPLGGSFVQHEIPPYNQPAPHEISMKGRPFYAAGSQSVGHLPGEHTPFPVPLHDPRHQKFVHVSDNQSTPQSPHYPS